MKEKIQTVKKFVAKHKVALAVTGTAATCLTLNRLALKQHDDFLREKGLYEEFYLAEEEPQD